VSVEDKLRQAGITPTMEACAAYRLGREECAAPEKDDGSPRPRPQRRRARKGKAY
jgi:hypothetical protein